MPEIIKKIISWFRNRQPKQLVEQIAVEWDENWVYIRVLSELDASPQQVRWEGISQVCFRDGGPWFSDLLYLHIKEQTDPCVVPIEARGGNAFFTELGRRGLFPQPVTGQAIRSTDGGLYCWPPNN